MARATLTTKHTMRTSLARLDRGGLSGVIVRDLAASDLPLCSAADDETILVSPYAFIGRPLAVSPEVLKSFGQALVDFAEERGA